MVTKPSAKRRPGKPKRPASLSPEASPANLADRVSYYLPVRETGGVRVTEDSAMTLGAVFACVRVIAETLAALPMGVFDKLPGGGRRAVDSDPADWLLSIQANPETPALQWRETMLAWALTWGNGYAEIERDLAGRPLWLWQLAPDRVTPIRDDMGQVVYRVCNYDAPDTYLPADDVFHLRGLGFDGLVGYPVVRLAARAIGLGISLQTSASTLAANDSTPGGILKHPQRLSETAKLNLVKSWQQRHGGPSNRRTLAVLEEGMEWQQTGLPPEDSQLLEQMQFTPSEICRWFRVQPHKIADLSRATFSNIEHQATEFWTDTLMPWAVRLESEANIKLFGRTNRGRRITKINMLGLLRGDSEARSAFYTAMLDRGVFSINDVLEKEDMNPIGPDGDKRFVQVNMQLLEKAGEEPPTATIAPDMQPTGQAADDREDMPEDDAPAVEPMAAIRPVIEDAVRRVMSREMVGAARTRKRIAGDNSKWPAWLADFADEQATYAREALRPGLLAAGLLAAAPHVSDVVCELFRLRYVAGLPARCAGEMDYEPIITEFTDSILSQITAAAGAVNNGRSA